MRTLWLLTGFALVVLTSGVKAAEGKANAANTFEIEYAARNAKAESRKSAVTWLELAAFCEERRQYDKYIQALHKVVEIDANNVDAHARLGEVKVGAKWLPLEEADASESKEKKDKGLVFYGAAWITPAQAEPLRAADSKTVGFDVNVRIDGKYVTVYSALSTETARRAAYLLDREVRVWSALYEKTWQLKPAPALKLYLLKDNAAYQKTYQQVFKRSAPGGSVGSYGNGSDFLVAAPTPGAPADAKLDLLQVIVHEMTHALDNRMIASGVLAQKIASTPGLGWVLEGRADYMKFSCDGLNILPGSVSMDPRIVITDEFTRVINTASLKDMLEMKAVSMDRKAYFYAWALVHFLYHAENGKYVAGFNRFLQALPQSAGSAGFEANIGGISEIEPLFKKHALEVILPEIGAAQKRNVILKDLQ
ncbi:MAG TPA: hypothetical protein VL860_14060 [Planctomycetota bacterium]|nr:hypothetical protein [Planctomycetota bacterium]